LVFQTGHKQNGKDIHTHYDGYKLDLKVTGRPDLEKYIKEKFEKIEDRSPGNPQWKNSPGNDIYCLEEVRQRDGSIKYHWDIKYQ